MLKLLATCAVLAAASAFALPEPANAAGTRLDGYRVTDQVEVSDARRRRYRHYHRRYFRGPRFFAPPFFFPRPYYYRPYSYYYGPRYYYRPRPILFPFPFFSPFWF